VGFNRRKMEDQCRQAAEMEAAARRATDAQVLENAERLITAWNERQAKLCRCWVVGQFELWRVSRINSLFVLIKRIVVPSPAENTITKPSGVGDRETDCAPA
jgi:hypothetical protein